MAKYEYKLPPLVHQREYLIRAARLIAFMLFWEPGCGKTKPTIDNFCFLYEEKQADALVVVAPNGVQRNWVTDEVPKHMPDRVRSRLRTLMYRSGRMGTKKAAREMKALIEHDGPVMVVANYEITITHKFKQFYARLQKARKIFLVLDEGHRIKGGKTHVKITLTALGKYARYRRLLTGTPLEKPEDIFSQVRFVDNEFWLRKGFKTRTEFNYRYQIYRKRSFRAGNRQIEREVPVGTKNLLELAGYLKEISHRLTKEEAGLNLPPKLYSRRYFEMTPTQRRIYEELRRKKLDDLLLPDHQVELDSGNKIKIKNAMGKMLRLQQIACGYVACDREQPEEMLEPGVNRRLDMVVAEAKSLPHQAIIWARFRMDIDLLCDALGRRAVRYDGQVDGDTRALNKAAFQAGEAQFFVGSIKAGGMGLTLTGAKTVLYYSNYFDLITRLQSEDRAHRIGQDVSVGILDCIAEETVDEYIVEKLQAKFDIAAVINQDAYRKWIGN